MLSCFASFLFKYLFNFEYVYGKQYANDTSSLSYKNLYENDKEKNYLSCNFSSS